MFVHLNGINQYEPFILTYFIHMAVIGRSNKNEITAKQIKCMSFINILLKELLFANLFVVATENNEIEFLKHTQLLIRVNEKMLIKALILLKLCGWFQVLGVK